MGGLSVVGVLQLYKRCPSRRLMARRIRVIFEVTESVHHDMKHLPMGAAMDSEYWKMVM